ncbi:Protein DYAD [Acorus gramineus]|uniref:Protein DYAD n=1 Tax=Acorus gramineus TaxID=55184 RepID=A0AAV9BFH1_ACOGR|nr:Protein DYAD [Acorus gramineus]
MREKGAVLGNPILRPELRAEARKHIGDTGLLDHLLKHMAGKVVYDGKERFRRRHNPDGAMEYWLEAADLIEARERAGIVDPYWVPPPGWKPGDGLFICGAAGSAADGSACAREVKDLKEEVASLKR